MPSIEEKLEILDKIIYDDATRARDAILAQLRQDSNQRQAGVKEEIERDAAHDYRRVSQRSIQERDSRISRANINSRKMLMSARNDIISSVLAELADRLAAFARTEEYRGFLMKNIQDALAQAGAPGEGFCLYLTPADYGLYSQDARALAPFADVRAGGAEMLGGVMAQNPAAGIYIDNTLKMKVDLCVDELFKISGLRLA